MKHMGSTCDFSEARDRDLMRAYRHVLKDSARLRLCDIFRRIVHMPSVRFWVSDARAIYVCSAIARIGFHALRGMNKSRRDMYSEIYRRTRAITDTRPGIPFTEAVREVLKQPAPRFYLTPASAKTILNRYRKKCRNVPF